MSNNIDHESVTFRGGYQKVASYGWLVDHEAMFVSESKPLLDKEKMDNIYTTFLAITKDIKTTLLMAWNWFIK